MTPKKSEPKKINRVLNRQCDICKQWYKGNLGISNHRSMTHGIRTEHAMMLDKYRKPNKNTIKDAPVTLQDALQTMKVISEEIENQPQ